MESHRRGTEAKEERKRSDCGTSFGASTRAQLGVNDLVAFRHLPPFSSCPCLAESRPSPLPLLPPPPLWQHTHSAAAPLILLPCISTTLPTHSSACAQRTHTHTLRCAGLPHAQHISTHSFIQLTNEIHAAAISLPSLSFAGLIPLACLPLWAHGS